MIFTIRRVGSGRTTEEEKPCEEAFALDGRWVVQIFSLEELVALGRKVGNSLIIEDEEVTPNVKRPNIRIYDDYCE